MAFCRSEWQKKYREANREKIREKDKRYRERNRDRVLARNCLWRENNREKRNAGELKYRQKIKSIHPDRLHKYRYRIGHTAKWFLLIGQGGRCAWCASNDPGAKQGWHTDHDHGPVGHVRGVLCQKCNSLLEHYVANGGIDYDSRARDYLSPDRLAAVTITLFIAEFYHR